MNMFFFNNKFIKRETNVINNIFYIILFYNKKKVKQNFNDKGEKNFNL